MSKFAGFLGPIAGLLFLTIGACSSHLGDAGRTTELAVGDDDLLDDLEIRNVRTRRDVQQRLQVEFELHNTRWLDLEFEWGILWFDADGFRLEAPIRYEEMELDGDTSRTISIVAPDSRATGWKLDVR